MTLLIAGVVVWSITHLFPAAAPQARDKLARNFGEGLYKGLFALDIVIALVLIVFGWKAATPSPIYMPPLYGSPIPSLLLVTAILLFVASGRPTNLKRFVRHPQMIAVLFWSAGHLLTNGDIRSVILFGGMGAWALLEIIFLNKRDGAWRKPGSVPHAKDANTAIITAAVFVALVYFHPSLFGVAAIPA